MLVLLAGTHLYFTIRLGFIQRKLPDGLRRSLSSAGSGGLSPYEALSTALAATIGTGNIIGISSAIAIGGPGAVFWCWISGFFGMATCYAESVLSAACRKKRADGSFYGGPMYVMEQLLHNRLLAVLFSVFTVLAALCVGSGVQAHSLTAVISRRLPVSVHWIGIAAALLAGSILIGGAKKTAKVCTCLVPVMSVIYILMGIAMILVNIQRVPATIVEIFTNAFTGTAAIGGFAGCAVSEMIRVGMARSVYSNEAGWGTSPMIHASAKTRHPVEQGLWGSFEVFFDTFIICSITALSVILSGNWTDGTNGGTLALSAFSSGFGTVGSLLLAVIMVVFTVTTSGGWFTYYLAILEHLYKQEGIVKDIVMKLFYAVRALPGLLWTIYLVKTDNQGFIWTVVDITSAIPTFVNVAVILLLSSQYFKLLKDYKARYLGEGAVDPNMKLFYEEKVGKEEA